MRKSGSWQSVWDDRILEYLTEHETGTPKKMKESGYFEVSRPQISNRLRKLADHGLVVPLGNGVYRISKEGRAYLNEEYDAEAGCFLDGSCSGEGTHTENSKEA